MRMQKRPRTHPPDCLQSSDNSRETSGPKRACTGAARQANNRAKVFFCTVLSFSLRFFMFTAFIYYNVFFYNNVFFYYNAFLYYTVLVSF